MEVRELPRTIVFLIALSMLIGIGLIVLINFGDAVRTQVAVVNEVVNLTTANVSVSLTYDELVTTVTPVVTNYSGTALTTFTIDYTAGTVTRVSALTQANGTYFVDYTYYSDTTATTAMDNVSTAVNAIPATWLGLIVTLMALAIILRLVITSFSGR